MGVLHVQASRSRPRGSAVATVLVIIMLSSGIPWAPGGRAAVAAGAEALATAADAPVEPGEAPETPTGQVACYFRFTIPENTAQLALSTVAQGSDGGSPFGPNYRVYTDVNKLPTAATGRPCSAIGFASSEPVCIMTDPSAGEWYVLVDYSGAFAPLGPFTITASWF